MHVFLWSYAVRRNRPFRHLTLAFAMPNVALDHFLSGKVLFPDSPNVSSWSPPSNASHPNDEHALTLELPGFDTLQAHHGQGNNTLAIKFTSPTNAKRFRYVVSV
jgi:hypothetical protein